MAGWPGWLVALLVLILAILGLVGVLPMSQTVVFGLIAALAVGALDLEVCRVGRLTVWHGDTAQAYALFEAIAHNCQCGQTPPGTATPGCPAHRALGEQRFVDGLLFACYLRERLLAEELR